MGQGFQRKIDAIVDSIVSSEKENNRKIDGSDIAESIKRAISDLNDVGKLLVLEDLSIEAGSKPSTLLTIDGKISVPNLNKVVVAKIKEAEREGIDLREGQQIIKENNKDIKDGILVIAAINKMIENYQELTEEERQDLLSRYSELSSKQQREIDNAVIRNLDETINGLSEEQKEECGDIIERVENSKKTVEDFNQLIELMEKENLEPSEQNQLDKLVKELQEKYPQLVSEDGTINISDLKEYKAKIIPKLEEVNKLFEELKQLGDSSEDFSKKTKIMDELNKIAEKFPKLEKKIISQMAELNSEFEQVEYHLQNNVPEDINRKMKEINQINRYIQLYEKDQLTQEERDEIKRLEDGFEKLYKGTFNKIKAKEIKSTNVFFIKKYEEKMKRGIQDIANENDTSKKEATQENTPLLINSYDLLENNEKAIVDAIREVDIKSHEDLIRLPIETLQNNFSRQEIKAAMQEYKKYFATLDIDTIRAMKSFDKDEFQEALIEEFQDLKIGGNVGKIVEELAKISYDGNLKNIITDDKAREEFLQQLDQQIESLEPEKGEEQSQEEIDMEAVKAELSAIPKALVSIDASTQDIAEGMQGYKQLIDNLDTKEIEGKSNEDVLKVLTGKISEIALTGNANLILEMMTQIGFSGLKNSEMKIRPILTTVKSEFVQMIDDVSKEEYIEKARNEMLAKEPIKDSEAEPGMKSFMVDLRVATKERNDLTNQIVGKDEKQDSITGTSDSDATQGSTSSGKISLQNMMNTVQNVRMAEIKNVQDLMINIAKENTEMLQEQDELIQDEGQDMV